MVKFMGQVKLNPKFAVGGAQSSEWFRNRRQEVPLRVGVRGDLEAGAGVESIHRKQVDPGVPPLLYSAGDFPSTNQQKSKG